MVSIHDTHFWTLCTDIHYGTAIVDILEGSDSQKILSATRSIFTQVKQLIFTVASNFILAIRLE